MAETPAAASPQELERATTATATATDDGNGSDDARKVPTAPNDKSGVSDASAATDAATTDNSEPPEPETDDTDPNYRSLKQARLAERLHHAAEKGDVIAVQALIEQGALVREDDQHGKSPIHLAAHHCHADVVALLKTHGVSIDELDMAGKTQLICDAESGNVREVQFLLDNGADVNATDLELKTALFAAAENGHVKIVNLLMERAADVHAVDQHARTSLFAAAKQGHLEIAKCLVDHGASVHVEQKQGRTPLMLAVSNGHANVTAFLLEHSSASSISHKDKNGWTPLHVAVGNGRTELVSLLVTKDASVDARGPDGMTSLYFAAQRGNAEIVDLLIKSGADVEAKQDQGKTSLLVTAENGFVKIVKLLTEAEVSVHESDKDGTTPLLAAAAKGHVAIVHLLVAGGASVNVKDSQEKTPLIAAAKSGHVEIVKFLVAKGANVDDTQLFGRTALMLAVANRHRQVVEFLLESGASLEVKDHAGWSPLHVAAGIKENSIILSMLIQKGARIDEKTLTGEAPLDLAIKKGCGEVIKELLGCGAKSVYKNPDYTTLLISAGRSGHLGILGLLINRGASLHARDLEDGETILLSAARWGKRGYFKLFARQSTLTSAALPDDRVSLLAGTLRTMKELCEGTREFKTIYSKVVERLTNVYLELQRSQEGDDRDKIFADIVYRVCRQLLRCRNRTAVARFIANDITITNVRDLHEEIDSFMKKFVISSEAAAHVNWLQSWTSDKEEQRKELRETMEDRKVLDAELTDEQDKVDVVTHLQFLVKNLRKDELADRSTAENVIQRLGGDDVSDWQIPSWFISRYNIEIDDWNSVGKSRFVKGRWMKSAVMISKCNLEVDQFEEIASTWQKLGHPNVLDLFGACHVGQPRFFVCDSAKDATLQGYLRKNQDCSIRLAKLHEAAQGMLYLHMREIVHGDLTTEKILVGEDGKIKIGGFELGITRGSKPRELTKNAKRSVVNWTSPEVQRGESPSFASDVYALGVCILDILTMDDPWRVRFDSSLRHYLLRSVTSPPPGIGSKDHWKLVKEMCAPSLSHRVSMRYVVTILDSFKSGAETDKCCEPLAVTGRLTSGNAGEPDKEIQPDVVPAFGKSIGDMLLDLEKKFQFSPHMCHMAEHIHGRLKKVHAYILTKNQTSADIATLDLIKIVNGFKCYLKTTTQETSYAQLLRSQKITFGYGSFHIKIDELLKDMKVPESHQIWEWKTLHDRHAVKLSIMQRSDGGSPDMAQSQIETINSARFSKRDIPGTQAVALRGESHGSPNQNWFIHLSEIVYDKGDSFAKGGFGEILHGVWLKGTHVVVKFILDEKETVEELFLHEVNVWHRLQHPHVVRLWGACNTGKRYFVCEFASNGTLSAYLKLESKKLTTDKLRRRKWELLHQAALGLQYVHGKIIIHNDLKCDNILIGDDEKAKLTDFGLSSMPNGRQLTFNPGNMGAVHWKAPEYLTSGKPSFESDIYSFAMCILEAITGEIPWGRMIPAAAVKYHVTKQGKIPSKPEPMSDNEWNLIELMTRKDPAHRVGISYVVGRLQEFTEEETTSESAMTTEM